MNQIFVIQKAEITDMKQMFIEFILHYANVGHSLIYFA